MITREEAKQIVLDSYSEKDELGRIENLIRNAARSKKNSSTNC